MISSCQVGFFENPITQKNIMTTFEIESWYHTSINTRDEAQRIRCKLSNAQLIFKMQNFKTPDRITNVFFLQSPDPQRN